MTEIFYIDNTKSQFILKKTRLKMRDSHLHLAAAEGLARLKWEWEEERTHYPDLLGFGTADMDYMCPGPMLDALSEVIEKGHLGYPMVRDEFYDAIHDHLLSVAGWDIDARTSVAQNVGIYTSAWNIIETLTKPGDRITILTPVHMCFRSLIRLNDRVAIECPLVYSNGKYSVDYQNLEACLASGSRIFWLCNPHNPIGHAWRRDELEKIAELCIRHDVVIMSDDVYSGLLFPGTSYTPMASLDRQVSERTITMYSTSKSYNSTGLRHSFIVAENPELMKLYTDSLQRLQLAYGKNILGMAATVAAYRKCGAWLDELNAQIKKNHDYLSSYFHENMPGAAVVPSDSTYFAWCDMRALKISPRQLSYLIECEEHMIVENGAELGKGGNGFIRINLATSEENLREGASRLRHFWNKHSEGGCL